MSAPQAPLNPSKAKAGRPSMFRNKRRSNGQMPRKPKNQGQPKRAARTRKQPKRQRRSGLTTVAAPAAAGLSINTTFGNMRRRTMRTGLQRQFVGDVYTIGNPGTFATVFNQPINPANGVLFPVVSALAGAYEKYRFRKFVLHYHPTCSTGTAGTIAGYIDPDATDGADTNMSSVLSNQMKGGGVAWSPFSVALTNPGSKAWYYTSSLGVQSNATDRQNFPGVVRVCHDKMAGNVALGLLEVEYDIEFADQKPPQGLMANIPFTDGTVQAETVNCGTDGTFYGTPLVLGAIQASQTTSDSWNTAAHMHGVTFKDAGDDETFVNMGFVINESNVARWLFNIAVNVTASSFPVFSGITAGFEYQLGYLVDGAFTKKLSLQITAPGAVTSLLGAINDVSTGGGVWVLRVVFFVTRAGGSTAAVTFSNSTQRTPVLTACRATSDSNYGRARLSELPTTAAAFQLPDQLDAATAYLSTLSGSVSITQSLHPLSAEPIEERLARLEARLEAAPPRPPSPILSDYVQTATPLPRPPVNRSNR
jgi:hypothetical protein